MSARLVKAVLSTAVRLQLLRYTWCMRTVINGHDGDKVRVRVITALGGEAVVEIQVLKLILNGETLPLSEDLSKYSTCTLHFLGESTRILHWVILCSSFLFSDFRFRYSAIDISFISIQNLQAVIDFLTSTINIKYDPQKSTVFTM